MDITGKFTNANNGSPIVGIVLQAMDGNNNEINGLSDETDAGGNYFLSSTLLDNSGVWISVSDPSNGFEPEAGSPEFFQGDNQLQPVYSTLSSIPVWIWIVIAAIALAGYFGYISKLKKYL